MENHRAPLLELRWFFTCRSSHSEQQIYRYLTVSKIASIVISPHTQSPTPRRTLLASPGP